MASPDQYSSPKDFRIANRPPQVRTFSDVNSVITILYNTIQQIIRFIVPISGIAAGVLTLPPYTLATLPNTAANAGNICVIADGVGGQWLVYSNGVNWLYTDGTIAV